MLRGVVWSFLALFALVSCEPAPTDREVVARLADEAATARGRPDVPYAQVGRETRDSLLPVRRLALRRASDGMLVASSEGNVDVEFVCHPGVRGRSIVTEAKVVIAVGAEDLERESQAQIGSVECPHDGSPVTLTVRNQEPGSTTSIAVNGYLPPEDLHATAWKRIEPGHVLEFAIGMGRPAERASARFEIEVEGRGGDRRTLFDRTLDPAARPADRGWVEVVLPLGDVRAEVGPEVRFHFRTSSDGGTAESAFPFWGAPALARQVPRPEERPPNVILISLDTLRADRTGVGSGAKSMTPRLDAWARRGAVFERAIASANWTRPSHGTMLTGAYACVNGLADAMPAASAAPRWRERGLRPIARLLQGRGYRTAAFTENAYVGSASFRVGFDSFHEDPTTRTDDGGSIHTTIERAEAWLERHASDPFFLFLHTYEVHGPHAPSKEYVELHPVASHPWPVDRPPGEESEETAAAYAAEVRQTDDAIADFLRRLSERGLADRTIVIVTSDHGESFGEHGQWRGHGFTLFDDELHVPLLWVGPGIQPGTRIETVASLADIVPTLLDLLGLPIPAWVQGKSAAASLRTGVVPPADGRVVPSGSMVGSNSFTGSTWKLMYRRHGEVAKGVQMYDYRADPFEREPASGPVVAKLTNQYVQKHVASCEAHLAELEPPRAGQAGEPLPPPVDVERQQKLEALGYVE